VRPPAHFHVLPLTSLCKRSGDKKTQTHRPSCTKQPTLKKICANLRHLRIKNVCYQSVTGYCRFCLSPLRRIGKGALHH
jgi:hypothetical protein